MMLTTGCGGLEERGVGDAARLEVARGSLAAACRALARDDLDGASVDAGRASRLIAVVAANRRSDRREVVAR